MKLHQVAVAIDQLFNTFFSGWADETISARAWRNAAQGVRKWEIAMKAINGLFFWQKNHCMTAYKNEQERLHMPPAYRSTELL